MLLHMSELETVELSDEVIDTFVQQINDLINKTQQLRSNINEIQTQKNQEEYNNFVDIISLPIFYDNARSVINKRNIATNIELSFFKILCFTETWLTATHPNSHYFPSNFTAYRCDRMIDTNRRSGGVAVLVHQSLKSQQMFIRDDPQCEYLAIEIKIKPTPLILYVCYLSKFDAVIASMHHENIKQITSSHPKHRLIVLGDFNVYDVHWALDESEESFVPYTNVMDGANIQRSIYFAAAMKFLQDMASVPLYQMSNITNSAGNVLDLVFVSDAKDIKVCVDQFTVIEQSQQDDYHKPYEITMDYCAKSSVSIESSTVYSYARGNYEKMCIQLDKINFAHEINTRDVDSAYTFFCHTMNTLIQNNVPKVRIKNYDNKPKWWTSELQRKKNRRDKLFKRKPKGIVTDEFKKAVDEFNVLQKKLHSEYIEKVQANIKSNPAEFWNFAKMNSKSSTYPRSMHYRERMCSTPSEMVELFADYFESIYEPDEEVWRFEDIFHESLNTQDINISLHDVAMAINSLKWKSGAGPDEIPPFVVKKCIDFITWPIWLLYQKTFEQGRIPVALKLSRVVPVHKKGQKSDVTNYRVIAISSVIMKVFEIAVKDKLNLIVEPKLSNAQHGFRANRSVTTNLMNVSTYAHKAFISGEQVDIFYGDFKNAFDKVWHRKLVEKLSKFDIGIKTAKWLYEFLTSRKCFVKIGKHKSRCYSTPSGVPAGSTLGPIVFSIFINDMADVIEHGILLLFADDSKIMLKISNTTDCLRLQHDINNVLEWCNQNRLQFNNQKCAIFTAARSANHIQTNYQINEHSIERLTEIRDLGVWLDRCLAFGHHIEQITIKCRQLIGCIKRYSNGNFTLDTQKVLYLAYVRSRLEFASVIWNPYQEIYISDIESIQKQFAMYLLEIKRNVRSISYLEKCRLLNVQPLRLRREMADALFAYDIYTRSINDPQINKYLVPLNPYYRLRDVRLLDEPLYRTDYTKYQPIARIIRIINEHTNIVRDSTCKTFFKNNLTRKLMNYVETVEDYV